MPTNMVKGFNVGGSTVQYDYESLSDRLLKSSIGEIYNSSSTYKVDEYVLYAGQLYRCIVEVTTPQSFDSTKWEPVSVGDDLKYIKKYFCIDDGIKQALLNLLSHVAYTDEHGQDYYDALEAELFRTADLVSISAVFEQGSAVIYDTDSLDDLKQYLTVTAHYEDGTSGTITSYTLSGELTAGTSTITVSYGGNTTTFDVTVTASGVYDYDSVGTPSISDNILTPGDSGLIRTTRVFSPGNNPWKIQVGFTTGTLQTTGTVQDIVGSVDSSGASQRGVLIENAYYAAVTTHYSQGYLSSAGASWDICSGNIVDSVVSNTTYLMQLEFTGTQYTIRKSTDGGDTWSPITTSGTYHTAIASTSKVKEGYYLGVGLKRSGYLNGTIDLTKVKVWINGELWWQPIR